MKFLEWKVICFAVDSHIIKPAWWNIAISVFLAACMTLLTACAVPPYHVQTAEKAEPSQTIVMGRLSVMHDGKETKWGHFQPSRILIARLGSRNAVVHEQTRADGMFFWALEPGDYQLVGVTYAKRCGWADTPSSRMLRIWGHFKVPQEMNSIYIGTLKVVVIDGAYVPRIENEYTLARKAFRSKYPGRHDPTSGLIELEKSVGTYAHVKYACSPGWGIECTKKYHGITLVEPKVEPDAFPMVNSLTPTFTWQASSMGDVSYDILIYEAMTYKYVGILTEYIPGRIVAYQQDLTQAEYRHPTPLEAGQNYYWSLRLRRGDVVSNWSRLAYFKFMIFAAKSGQTAWFGFSTPAENNSHAEPH